MKSSDLSNDKRQTTNDAVEIEAGLGELGRVVDAMRRMIPSDAVIALEGDLAAGKTTLVRAIAEAAGAEGTVTSPTFSLQHRYGEGLIHYDLYRSDFDELAGLGLLGEFEAPGWHLVEWMDDRLKAFLTAAGYNLYRVSILPAGDRRIYRIGPLDA